MSDACMYSTNHGISLLVSATQTKWATKLGLKWDTHLLYKMLYSYLIKSNS